VFEAIRRDRRDDPDVSIRELATRHGVHRRTLRQALASAQPPARRVPLRVRVRLLEEHQLVLAYSTVRDYARPRIRLRVAGRTGGPDAEACGHVELHFAVWEHVASCVCAYGSSPPVTAPELSTAVVPATKSRLPARTAREKPMTGAWREDETTRETDMLLLVQ
jgi:hypothetical protein